MDTPLEKAVDLAGGQTALARVLSGDQPGRVKQGHVWTWLYREKRAPVEWCPAIEAATGVRCEVLRPDTLWTRDASGKVTGYHVPIAA